MGKSLTLEQIINAADRLVEADGLDGLSMRRLAGELHVAHSGLYSYNLDRQVLHVALLERRMTPMMSAFQATETLEPTERLMGLGALLLKLFRTCPVSRQIAVSLIDDGVFAAGATGSFVVDWLEALIDRTCIEIGGEQGAGEIRAIFDAISRAPLVAGCAGPRSEPLDSRTEQRLLAALHAGLDVSETLAA